MRGLNTYMYDAIFLNTPSGLFADVSEARRRARALYDYIKRFCDKNNIYDTNLDIGVSNVNPRKAQYINKASGVGRPQKILVGNLKKCFVRPHLHMIVQGCHASEIANIIIEYFRKRYPSLKNPKYGVRIRKDYILSVEVDRVKKYIRIQSLHYLTLKATKNENKKETKKKINKRIIKVRVKKTSYTNKNEVSQGTYNQNQIILCNLRCQWMLVQQLKKIADYTVNYELYNSLIELQNEIEVYGNITNSGIDVASLYSDEIVNITIRLENLRQYTIKAKEKFDYFVGQA